MDPGEGVFQDTVKDPVPLGDQVTGDRSQEMVIE